MYDISTPIIIRQTAQRIDYLRAENNFTYRDLSKKIRRLTGYYTQYNTMQKNPKHLYFTMPLLCFEHFPFRLFRFR